MMIKKQQLDVWKKKIKIAIKIGEKHLAEIKKQQAKYYNNQISKG